MVCLPKNNSTFETIFLDDDLKKDKRDEEEEDVLSRWMHTWSLAAHHLRDLLFAVVGICIGIGLSLGIGDGDTRLCSHQMADSLSVSFSIELVAVVSQLHVKQTVSLAKRIATLTLPTNTMYIPAVTCRVRLHLSSLSA
jgi:hypothetical protein